MSKGCTARVMSPEEPKVPFWPSPTTACGDVVLRANLCSFHLRREEESLCAEIKDYEAEIAKCRKRLDELTRRSGCQARR
jgi:hypothetical protein